MDFFDNLMLKLFKKVLESMFNAKVVMGMFGMILLLGVSAPMANASSIYNCNPNNIDSEWLVYSFTTSELEKEMKNFIKINPNFQNEELIQYLTVEYDLDLWYELDYCLNSYGINPETIIETPSIMKKYLVIPESNNPEIFEIPKWIKDAANSWIEDKNNVYQFTNAISFLSKTNTWNDSVIIQYASGSSPQIPLWTENVVSWWIEDKVSNEEFVNFLENLSDRGIIKI